LDGIKKLVGDSIPHCTWFDKKYLEIQDVSGNPFRDGKVKGFKISERNPFNKGPRSGARGRDDQPRQGAKPMGGGGSNNFNRNAGPKSKAHGRSQAEPLDSKRQDRPGRFPKDSNPRSSAPQKGNHRFDGKAGGRADHRDRSSNRPYSADQQRPFTPKIEAQKDRNLAGKNIEHDKKGFFALIKNVVKSIFGSKES
jgi:hypothetical protein